MSLSQLAVRARVEPLARWLPEPGAGMLAFVLVVLTAGLYGLLAPGLNVGVYVLLAPLALGLAALILVRPEIGLMLMFLTAPLESTYLDLGVRVKPHQVIGLLTLAGWALQLAIGRWKHLRDSSLKKPLAFLVLTFVLAFALHLQYLSLGISLFALQLWFIVVIFLVANFVDEPGLLQRCLWMFVIAGILEAALAIVQAAGYYHTASTAATYGSILNHGRPAGTFSETDFLAPFLVGSLLLVLPFWGSKSVGRWTPLVYGAVLLLLTAAILAMVRASWLGMIAGLAVFGWLKLRERGDGFNFGAVFKRYANAVVALVIVLVALAVVWPTAFSTVTVRAKNMVTVVEPQNPHATRAHEMQQAWAVVKQNPIFGNGVGTVAVSTEYGRTVAASSKNGASGVVGAGLWLGLFHDQGVIGLLAFASVLALLLRRLMRALKTVSATRLPYVQGALACVIGLTVSAMFNNLYYFGYYWLIIALAAALVERPWSARPANDGPATG